MADSNTKVHKEEREKEPLRKKIRHFFGRMSSVRQILLWYLIISLTGALLLWMPITHTKEFNAEGAWGSLSFIDALFVSSSAFSDTGLSPVGISETFNFFGELVTLVLLQVGGVGWFTIKIFILHFILQRTTTYSTLADSTSELGTSRKDETLGLVFCAIITTILASIIGGLIFSLIFFLTGDGGIDGVDKYHQAFWTGIYHASASVNNSGLDIFAGNDSMSTLYGENAFTTNGVVIGGANQYIGWTIVIQSMTLFLFVLGGMGFGIIYDVYKYSKRKKTGNTFSFSLVTKLSVVAYVIVAFSGLGLAFLSEGLATIGDPANAFLSQEWIGATDGALQIDNVGLISELEELMNTTQIITADQIVEIFEHNTDFYYDFVDTSVSYRCWTLAFNTFSTRNAGFATMDLAHLQDPTKFTYILMMFIGSGPGSTAGGLRTTTFAVIVVSLWAVGRNKPQPHAFGKGIPADITRKAFSILAFSLMIVFMDILIISIVEFTAGHTKNNFIDNMFVVFSAYGTTGLSIADLGTYHWLSKITLILLMFIGQMGISNTLGQASAKQIQFQKHFVEERINLG